MTGAGSAHYQPQRVGWLSVAQLVSWGSTFYLFALLMTIIATVMWRKGSRSSGQAAVCIPLDHAVTAADYRQDGPRCQRDACGNLILTSRCARLLLLTGAVEFIR